MIDIENRIDYFCKNAKILKMCLAQVEQMSFLMKSSLLKLSKCNFTRSQSCSS